MDRYDVSHKILHCLAQQGFCVVDLKPSSAAIEEALRDAKGLKEAGQFTQPPAEIVDGLLGQEGSAHICELYSIAEDDVPKGVRVADDMLFEAGDLIQPLLEKTLGMSIQGRTLALLHEVGEPSSEPTPMNEVVCDKWLNTFVQHRLMILLFLGPHEGILELQPFDEDGSEVYEVRTEPGMIVFLRADMLQHRLYGVGGWGGSMALSCWYLEQNRQHSVPEAELTPAARSLFQWGERRLGNIKAAMDKGSINAGQQDLPRHWVVAAARLFRKAEPVALNSVSCRFPASMASSVFWSGVNFGGDFAVEIPKKRFDIEEWFDADLESHKWMKTYARHGIFIEGADMFDNRFFGISPVEAAGMDPTQYLLMEAGYEALYHAGRRKKDLMQALIGVYVGQGLVETAPKDSVAMGGTGAARAVSCGRISFALGMQGPCCAIDSEGATAFSCLEIGHQAISNQKATFNTALAGAVMLTFSPRVYVYNCAAHVLNPLGRCCTFDTTAMGYVKGEGCGFGCLKRQEEVVDGERIVDDDSSAVFAAIKVGCIGRSANLGAPNAPAEQALIADTLRQADISALNVEIVECVGDGCLMADAVEVGYLGRGLRFDEPYAYPLHLGAVMTSVGFMREASGFAQLLKVIEGLNVGVQAPNIHLCSLNPHTDEVAREAVLFPTESVACRISTSFAGITSRGLGGTVTHTIMSCKASESMTLPHVQPQSSNLRCAGITYWPGGGGQLDERAAPSVGYSILGSWTEWVHVEPMQEEESGVYAFTVALPEMCYAFFQILLDGDTERVLHPDVPDAAPGTPVLGPGTQDGSAAYCWMIDAREHWVPKWGEVDPVSQVPTNGAVKTGESPELFWALDPSRETGKPGDRFRVRLRVAGQWRIVDWEALDAEHPPAVCRETYHVAGSFNDWSFSEMVSDKARPGHYHFDANVARAGSTQFQIAMNKDWSKVFHPASFDAQAVDGPDDVGPNLTWSFCGEQDSVYRIEFSREQLQGMEKRAISWHKVSEYGASAQLPAHG